MAVYTRFYIVNFTVLFMYLFWALCIFSGVKRLQIQVTKCYIVLSSKKVC